MAKKYKLNDDGTVIEGVVKISIEKVIELDTEGFLDYLSDQLVESSLLMDIRYEVIGNEGNTLILKVTGDPSECDLES